MNEYVSRAAVATLLLLLAALVVRVNHYAALLPASAGVAMYFSMARERFFR